MHEINEQWLKDNGFFWEMRHPRFHIIVWTDKTHRIEFRQGYTNRKDCKCTFINIIVSIVVESFN